MNILIITYYWPPSGGSGVQRWVYFSKYLKKYGYNPIIITVDPKFASFNLYDYSLINQVDDIETHKTKSLEVLKLYSLIKSGNKSKEIPQSYIPNETIFDKISSFIRLNFFVPDSRIGWNSFAYRKAKEIISNNKIDLIVTTGPPHSTHLVGKKIQNNFKLKWIVDFRDPWSELFYLNKGFRFNISKRLNEKLELEVLESADSIITTAGSRYHNILSKKISNSKKIYKIYNGYDKIHYDKIEEIKPKEFNIVFTGVLSKNHNYKIFNNVLDSLKINQSNMNIVLTIAGKIDENIKKLYSNKVKLVDRGYVNHDEAIKIMKSSHLLINFNYKDTEKTDMISGKLIEYLASGSPIINFSNLAHESKLIMNSSPKSFNANDNDLIKVVDFIKNEYNQWANGSFKKNIPKNIDSLSREKLTKNLIDIIDSII